MPKNSINDLAVSVLSSLQGLETDLSDVNDYCGVTGFCEELSCIENELRNDLQTYGSRLFNLKKRLLKLNSYKSIAPLTQSLQKDGLLKGLESVNDQTYSNEEE